MFIFKKGSSLSNRNNDVNYNRYYNNRYNDNNNNLLPQIQNVNLSISYRNKYDNIHNIQRLESQRYGNFLQKQINYKNLRKSELEQQKRKEAILEELRLAKERHEMALRQYNEKQKIQDTYIKSSYHNTQIIQDELFRSLRKLDKAKSMPDFSRTSIERQERERLRKAFKDPFDDSEMKFDKTKSIDENIDDNIKRMEVVDSRIFNGMIMDDILKLKFENTLRKKELEKVLEITFQQSQLNKNYKDLLVKSIDALKKEMEFNKNNNRFLKEFFKSEYVDKVLQKKKEHIKQEKEKMHLPYITLDKDGYSQDGSNVVQHDNELRLSQGEPDLNEAVCKMDLWNVNMKNHSRLYRLNNYEQLGLM